MLSENDSNWLGQFTFYHNFCHVICDACYQRLPHVERQKVRWAMQLIDFLGYAASLASGGAFLPQALS